jgi:hypothetical protein
MVNRHGGERSVNRGGRLWTRPDRNAAGCTEGSSGQNESAAFAPELSHVLRVPGTGAFSWGQPIATCDEPATAAIILARVLRTADSE